MANQPTTRRRVRRKSFTAQFALVLVAVGLATAVVAGAVAWVETQQARTQQQTEAGLGASRLAGSLVRTQTATASERFACEVAALPTTATAYSQGASSLETVAQAAVANASPGQIVVLVGTSGQVLASAPAKAAAEGGANFVAGGSSVGTAGCADPGKSGFFTLDGDRQLFGAGLAKVDSGGTTLGRVFVLTPVAAGVLK
ncbi:MAG: hypothetical protein WA976_05320, partial [Candidatus Dormiibacterota bacterium]